MTETVTTGATFPLLGFREPKGTQTLFHLTPIDHPTATVVK